MLLNLPNLLRTSVAIVQTSIALKLPLLLLQLLHLPYWHLLSSQLFCVKVDSLKAFSHYGVQLSVRLRIYLS